MYLYIIAPIIFFVHSFCDAGPAPKKDRTDSYSISPVRGNLSAPWLAIAENAELIVQETMNSPVPPGISIAIMIQEGGGTSSLYLKHNNLFGVKTKGARKHIEMFDVRPSKFVVYPDRLSSIRHHVEVLSLPRYRHLHGKPDSFWIDGVAKAGYAEAKDYSKLLKKLYEHYHLERYTSIKSWYQSCHNRKGF